MACQIFAATWPRTMQSISFESPKQYWVGVFLIKSVAATKPVFSLSLELLHHILVDLDQKMLKQGSYRTHAYNGRSNNNSLIVFIFVVVMVIQISKLF